MITKIVNKLFNVKFTEILILINELTYIGAVFLCIESRDVAFVGMIAVTKILSYLAFKREINKTNIGNIVASITRTEKNSNKENCIEMTDLNN